MNPAEAAGVIARDELALIALGGDMDYESLVIDRICLRQGVDLTPGDIREIRSALRLVAGELLERITPMQTDRAREHFEQRSWAVHAEVGRA